MVVVGGEKMVVRRLDNSAAMSEGSRTGSPLLFPLRVRGLDGLGHVAALAEEKSVGL